METLSVQSLQSSFDPFAFAISVSQRLGQKLLKDIGAVPPFGIAVHAADGSPETYYPRSSHPELDWGSLVDVTVEKLRGLVSSGVIAATAVVSQVEYQGKTAFVTQVETPGHVALLFYPYEKLENGWEFGPDSYLEGQVFCNSIYPMGDTPSS